MTSDDGMATLHVYDADGNPVDVSKLQGIIDRFNARMAAEGDTAFAWIDEDTDDPPR